MVNSTKISSRLSKRELPQYYEIFLNSMSRIIGKFGGHVIKNVGDCLLYYFPKSSNSSKDSLQKCLECGLVMIEVHPLINKILKSKKLPKLNYRISADFGSVVIMSNSKSDSVDLIGPAVNICAKINSLAESNEFIIGNDLKEIAKKINGYKFVQVNSFDSGLSYTYSVYKVRRK